TSTVRRWYGGIKCQTLRQQAQAKSRSFRSLALLCKNSSIGSGSVHSSHSASVMASLLAQDEVERPAPPDVRPRPPAMREDFGGAAAGCSGGVGNAGGWGGVPRAVGLLPLLVDAFCKGGDGAIVPGEDGERERGRGVEGGAEDAPQEMNLCRAFAPP